MKIVRLSCVMGMNSIISIKIKVKISRSNLAFVD